MIEVTFSHLRCELRRLYRSAISILTCSVEVVVFHPKRLRVILSSARWNGAREAKKFSEKATKLSMIPLQLQRWVPDPSSQQGLTLTVWILRQGLDNQKIKKKIVGV